MGEDEMEEVIKNLKEDFAFWTPSLDQVGSSPYLGKCRIGSDVVALQQFETDHAAISDSMKEMTQNIRSKAARADREAHTS